MRNATSGARRFARTNSKRRNQIGAGSSGSETGKRKRSATSSRSEREPADLGNTVLKMSAKRARVDGIKSTVGASDVFDQDGGTDTPREKRDAAPQPTTGDGTPELLERAGLEWHGKGAISTSQANRIFAIAKDAGWPRDAVTATIADHLKCSAEMIPWGDPYDLVVEFFQTTRYN